MTDFSVLVVEDEPLIALDMEDMLREFGVSKIDIIDDYAAAEAALEMRDYGLVLFDLDLDGTSTAKLVAACVDRGCPAVVVSGTQDAPETLRRREVRILDKPLNAALLESVLTAAGLQAPAAANR